MSVGGRVAYTRDYNATLEVVTWDEAAPHDDFVGVQLRNTPEAREIQPGDSIWWQDRTAYWTPEDRARVDVEIPKITNAYPVEA